MKRTIFFDLDETLTTTKSKKTFKQHPKDVEVLPGIKEAIAYYQARNWQFIGISNQGGVAAGHKSIEDAIVEMQFTLELIPELSAIYFCPDFEGLICWRISKYESVKISDRTKDKDFFLKEQFKYRKPGSGMIYQATFDCTIDKSQSWYIGDRPEDVTCAKNADINFMWADIFRERFRPGMYEVRNATKEQVGLLEDINP